MGKIKRDPKSKTVWTTTAIPQDLYERIKQLAKKYNYTGVADFVKDSCRRRLEQLEQPQAIPA